MSPEAIPGIEHLLRQAGSDQELQFVDGNYRLRIDLRPDDMQLWQSYYKADQVKVNILLACESASGELLDTRLTWVVGAAIRQTWIGGQSQAIELLQALGISVKLAELAAQNCPGLGESIIWAFHLERHGWLTATPVK